MLAATLRDVFNTTNPTPLPSGDPRYVDCTAVRGNEDVVERLFRRITWSDQPHTAQLFTGHRGCGKSTELLRLKQRLEDANYAVIYFVADEMIDIEDIVYSDILVALARQVFEGLRRMEIELSADLLEEVYEWFAEVVYEKESSRGASATAEAAVSIGTPKILASLAELLVTLTGQLRTSVDFKQQIRRRLDPQIAQLIDKINLLLLNGNIQLQKRGKEGLVVIVDNLDRIRLFSREDGRNSHDALYIDHGEQLCACHCHVIYTVPIAMFYAPQAAILSGIFPDYQIMPMIKTHTQDNAPWPAGLAVLRQILASRIDLETIFTEEALQLLCEVSGGHPRHLMTLVRHACGYAVNRYPKPIDRNAAERAINILVSEYSRAIPEEHFPLLAEVHLTKQVKNNDEHRLMLHNASVLEYMNGSEPWQDVHPIVLRLAKFKQAYE